MRGIMKNILIFFESEIWFGIIVDFYHVVWKLKDGEKGGEKMLVYYGFRNSYR